MRKKFYFGKGKIQDGRLEETDGRIIIYQDHILVSRMRTADHNYLLRAFASRFGYKKDEVIANAIRLYFRDNGDHVIITETRRIDEEKFFSNKEFNSNLIKKELK